MLIIYEKLDNFLEEMRQESIVGAGKTQPVYMSVVRRQNPETNVMSAEIYIQLLKDGNALTYIYADLPQIRVIPPGYYDTVLNKEDAEMAKKNYEAKNKNINDKILEEYEKIKQVLVGYGYKEFKRAMVQ